MDRFTEGFLIGQMFPRNANGCGCLAIIGFGLFLILLCWNLAHAPMARARADKYYKGQREIEQERPTHTEKQHL